MQTDDMAHVELTGTSLTIAQVVAVARNRARVSIAKPAAHRVRCCRRLIDVLLERGEKVYGLTTGFGKLRDVVVAPRDVERLQVNLIRSHACGVGPAFDEDVVRAAILLRANTLCRGHSGIRLETLEALLALLNDGIYPWIPEQGSVGCSGDLAPLSHLGLVLMGDPGGRVLPRAARRSGADVVRAPRGDEFVACGEVSWTAAALSDAPTFRPVTLGAKEGLAINNGTQVMTAVACLALHDAAVGMAWAEVGVAMSLEAQRGVRAAFRPEVHAIRPLAHQGAVAARVLALVEESEILDVQLNTSSLRRAREAVGDAREHLGNAMREERPGIEGLAARDRSLPPSGLDPCASRRGSPISTLASVDGELGALATDLERLVPRQGPAPAAVLGPRSQPARAQLDTYRAMLSPLRATVSAALARLEGLQAPESSPIRARDALVRVLSNLVHACPSAPPVQDDYSTRCAPQVLACAHRALDHAREVVSVEINSATDNPLLFPPEPPGGLEAMTDAEYGRWLAQPAQAATLPDRVLGGGNFHGEPIAKVMDYFAIAMAEVASIAERRVAHMVDEALSNGLPPFLMAATGLNSGFMIPQYTAAALVSENKVLCHPASVDSIPTCAGSEDHVSMGTIAARKAARVLEHVLMVVAIEVLCANQALSFRAPLRTGRGVEAVQAFLRARGVEVIEDDRVMYPDMQRVRALVSSPPPV